MSSTSTRSPEIPATPRPLGGGFEAAYEAALADATNIVYAWTESIAAQRERMAPTSRHVMLFKHQYSLAGLGECEPSGHTASTRTDDNHVEITHLSLLVCRDIGTLQQML